MSKIKSAEILEYCSRWGVHHSITGNPLPVPSFSISVEEAAGGDGSLQLPELQVLAYSLLPLPNGKALKLSSTQHPTRSPLQEQRTVEPEQRTVEPEQRTVEPEQRTVELEQRPVEPEQRPVEPEQRPVEPEQRPVEPEQRTVEPEQRPVEPEQRTVEPEQRPVEPEQRTVEPEQRTVEPEQRPVEPQDPGQLQMVARQDSSVRLVRHEDIEPMLSIRNHTSNSDIVSHPHVATLAPNQVSPHSVPRLQTELHAPSTMRETVEDRFVIHPEFNFPHPRAVRSMSEILQSDWLKQLKVALHTMSTTQVTMVTSNLPYRDVLLNWLISAVVKAGIPLRDILVIAMENPLHMLLQERNVTSILVTPEALLNRATLALGTFNQVMMTRLALLRLLNHWGLDVAFYDTDAILLKDPQPVYNRHRSSGIVGVIGKFPTVLYREWRVTLCTAVMLVRSSKATGNGMCVAICTCIDS